MDVFLKTLKTASSNAAKFFFPIVIFLFFGFQKYSGLSIYYNILILILLFIPYYLVFLILNVIEIQKEMKKLQYEIYDFKNLNSKLENRLKTIDNVEIKNKNIFDVFLAHNSLDKPIVLQIADKLKSKGIKVWIDIEQIPPGRWFQDILQNAIKYNKSAAIFIGENSFGKWQALEIKSFITQCIEFDIPVIPVLLPGVKEIPESFIFLREFNHIKFQSIYDNEALEKLIWGINHKNHR